MTPRMLLPAFSISVLAFLTSFLSFFSLSMTNRLSLIARAYSYASVTVLTGGVSTIIMS